MNRIARIGCQAALLLALITAVSGAAIASPANPYTGSLVSNFGFSDTLVATVTQVGNLYHFEYALAFDKTYVNPNNGLSCTLATFSVDNFYNLEFLNPGNDKGMVNPIYGQTSDNSVLWTSEDGVSVGQTVRFWYDCVYSYEEVDVTMSSGRNAYGKTLGMVAVPEPSVLVSLALGLSGLSGMILKKRSAK